MKMMKSILTTLTVALSGLALEAATIPLNLPKPDGKPGDSKKPVKVYILAGQSNMVGMGNIAGASPEYPSVFLSADPAIIPGTMPAGSGRAKSGCKWTWRGQSALAKHGVTDAKAIVGSEKIPVALGTVSQKLPGVKSGDSLAVTAQIDVPVTGTYTVHVGFEESTYAVAAAPKAKKASKAEPLFTFTLPEGLANWAQSDFDVKQAGWKSGPAPFSMKIDENVPSNLTWLAKYPLYPLKRPMAKTIVENDVLLMRKTIDVPPLKEGYRYRVRVEGSIHDNSGEGFAVYVNGKLVGEIKEGITGWRKQGIRGVKLENSLLEAIKGGKMTIAVANFPMSNWKPDHFIPFFRPLSVWVEEQKLPPLQ
jgi:hypothetical protein